MNRQIFAKLLGQEISATPSGTVSAVKDIPAALLGHISGGDGAGFINGYFNNFQRTAQDGTVEFARTEIKPQMMK